MTSLTAVELGADICALARTSVRNGAVYVSAAETLDPAAFPGGGTFTLALRQSRKKLKLPRRCRVVLWGAPDGASRRDPKVKPRLAPLESAGYRIERVVSPCNALAALARLKTSRMEGATCWIAINRGGVAIVVVRPGKQLFAHSFIWDSTLGATGSQARLLQRYSLVSHLAPEVKHAMSVARQQGTPVVAIVTCGNLPDLRSMTMPLIEELDVEVETLDSLDGLEVRKEDADRLSEVAPAIRLACAGAAARSTRPWDESQRWKTRLERALFYAALAAAALGAGYVWYAKIRGPASAAFPSTETAPAAPAARAGSEPLPSSVESRPAPATRPTVPPPPPTSRAAATPAPARDNAPPATATSADPRQAPPQPAATAGQVPRPPPAELRKAPAQAPGSTRPAAPPNAQPAPRSDPGVNTSTVAADKPEARPARPSSATAVSNTPKGPVAKPPAPLPDAVPRITTILVSGERRYATVDGGQIVGIGDILGRRTVIAIDERSVVFREPSGLQVRVGLGGRLLGVGPGRW
jgi:hypothetical protein